jgi:hypothetical protein
MVAGDIGGRPNMLRDFLAVSEKPNGLAETS